MSQKKIILPIGLFIFLLSGCTQKIQDKAIPPENLIPREKMVDIIVDMELFDAVISSQQKKRINAKEIDNNKYFLHNSILNKYGITRDQFEKSFRYYQIDLDVIDEIFADAITKLSKMKSETELGQ
ncbi:MAG: hypothetical protein B6D61_02030 [Bacteroidetes bacterium 4484_249]|nr:MAG: hypothetical protein B6D61_02030 [Bacteroidetes bacterium 4484_249]